MRGVSNYCRPTRGRRRVVVSLLAGVALAAVTPAVASAEQSYVAMGDSYTVTGSETTLYKAETNCVQSADSYPYRVAEALHLSLTDVACGGADTEDFTVAQYEDQPPQFDALSPSTEVVSVSMGGNDHNLFVTVVDTCTELDSSDPAQEGAPCKKALAKPLKAIVKEDEPSWAKALEEIHARAPKAKVFYIGYPDITPAKGFCPEALPWTAGDLTWLHGFEKSFDHAIRKVAHAGGATYVETFAPSEGHDACQEAGVRWIEPLINPLNDVALHPNGAGEENDAYAAELAMLKAGVR
jgi:hypothetical protein